MRSVAPANAGFSIVARGVKRALNATRRRDGFVASTSESLLRPSGCWSAASVAADIVGGGGSATTDCLLVFDAAVNSPPTRPHDIRCTDGAPCDADGTVNGSCQFAVAVCANSTVEPRCTLNGVGSVTVDHALD